MRRAHTADHVLPIARVAFVWSFLTIATLCGPCRAPVLSPALAAEAAR